MPSQHIWTERDRDGRKREVRATKFGGVWRFQSKTAGEMNWTYHDVPLLDDLLKLKGIIARKYQRRRASADDVASVDELIKERETNDPASVAAATYGAVLSDGKLFPKRDAHD